MIDIQHPFYCPIRPLVNIFLAASAAYSAIAAKMSADMLITIGAVIIEEALAWIIAEKHCVNFFYLLFSKLFLMEKLIFPPIIIIR